MGKHLTQSPLLLSIRNLNHGFTRLTLPVAERDALNARTATAHQVHEENIVWTDRLQKAWTKADAVATSTLRLPVGVFTADCAPILLASVKDDKALAVMAVHAGWRGTAAGIAGKSVEEIWRKAPGDRLVATVGPAISFESFEVGDDVINAFPDCEKLGTAHFLRVQENKKKYVFDLPGENARQIESAAARLNIPLRLEVLTECTFLQKDRYPSYRRDKERAGRMLSFVELTG